MLIYDDNIVEMPKEKIIKKPLIIEKELKYDLGLNILGHLKGVCCNWRTREFVWEFCYDKYFK